MSTAGKVIIVISICVLLLIIGGVGAGAYWWSHHGRQALQAMENSMKQGMKEGEEAGKKTDNQGCVDQSLVRYKKSPGIGGALSTSIFLQGCLEESSPTPGFCDDVPRPNEIMKSASWQMQKCKDAGMPADPYCRQIFAAVQQYCERSRLKPKP